MSQDDEMATTNPQPSAQTAREMEHNSAIGEALLELRERLKVQYDLGSALHSNVLFGIC